MTEVVEGLDGAARARIEALRQDGRFFWLDVALSGTSPDELTNVLGVPARARGPLFGFGKELAYSRKFHSDGKVVVFAFTCFLESANGRSDDLQPVEVHVLVSGGYLVTLHEEELSLPTLLAPSMPAGGSDRYAVYAILDAMVASAFDALIEIELELDDMAVASTGIREGRSRTASLQDLTTRLSRMRRRVGPERGLFERIGVEFGRIDALGEDAEPYFDRLGDEVNRLVKAIDAAADAVATLVDLRLNETTYWLTVVATIFLPLTFITGFFGMNFGWMVDEIDTQPAFWLLGVGSLFVGVALIGRLIVRASPVDPED